jgi:crotonobetainyl-CoA:carnitine CoA-transferase CaiB-like acyl-CoA transferase
VTTPIDSFATHDGHLTIVVPTDDHFARLCQVIGRPELATDPRFADGAVRRENRGDLRAMLAEWFEGRRTDAAVALLQAADIPAGAVQDLAQAMMSPQAIAHGIGPTVDHPTFGRIRMVAQPAQFASGGTVDARREPLLGEDGDAVLQGILGRSPEEVAALREAGVTL